jgi:membrane protein implicated in regulation of membrane protease activity
MLFLVGLVLLFLLPSPWNLVAFFLGIVGLIGEGAFWYRRVWRTRVQAGAETMVGRVATVASPCKPVGQVRFAGEGEIWTARCAAGADRGQSVRVVEVDDITLIVEPVQATAGT